MSDKYFEQDGGFSLPSANIQNPLTPTETVEGMSERFYRDFTNDMGYVLSDAPRIVAFIQSELDLALTKERTRVNEVLEGMKNPDYNERNESNATLSDAQKRITDKEV